MKWTQPWYLLCLLAMPALLLMTFTTERYWQQLRRIWGGQTEHLHWRSRLRLGVVTGLCLILPVALSGLTVPAQIPQEHHDRVALAIGLDVSKSMLAEDVVMTLAPTELANRLNLGRSLIKSLLNQLAGEQIGLFLFARSGIEVVPLTRDHGFLRYILQHTDMARLTESGSDLLAAVATGDAMLDAGYNQSVAAMLLVSDGEDTENGPAPDVQALQNRGDARPIYTIRVGGDESVMIPIRKPGIAGIEGFYTDEQGNTLESTADDRLLQQLSAAAQGASWKYDGDEQGLTQQVAAQILSQARQGQVTTETTLGWYDLSGLLLLLALFFYGIYMLL